MGTSKIGIEIDRDARRIVERRNRIWEKYDQTLSQISELNRYSSTYSNNQLMEDLYPLTDDNTPPAEITEVLDQLHGQQALITRAKAKIESNLAEIAATKKQFLMVVGIAGAILIMIILFLIISNSNK